MSKVIRDRSSMGRVLGLGVVLLTLLAPSLSAQTDRMSRPRVTISGTFGYMGGGPTTGIEAMVRDGGFGDLLVGGCRLGFCDGDEQYPTTARDPGQASNLRVAYSQWSHLEVAFSTGAATPSHTNGYSQVLVPDFGRYSQVDSKVRMFAPTVGMRYHFVGVGAGPAYYRMNIQATDEDEVFDESTVTKVGALIEGDGQFSMFKKVILELRIQYRLVGGTEVGPYQLMTRTLPGTSVDFSHFYFGAGLGLAF